MESPVNLRTPETSDLKPQGRNEAMLEQNTLESDMSVQKICFIGAGHVGAPTAAVLAFFNPTRQVRVIDRNPDLIRKWNSGHFPFEHEPGLCHLVGVSRDGIVATHVRTEDDHGATMVVREANLIFSSNREGWVKDADMVFLCVETPTKTGGAGCGVAIDTTSLESAVEEVAIWAKKGVIVVVKSTVPVGTAGVVREMMMRHRSEQSFEVLSNPEFLTEGDAVNNLANPDRVLIGSSMRSSGRAAASVLANLYQSWIDPSKIQMMSSASAELAKLSANAMLAQKISSINAISALCEQAGADIADVRHALGTDPRIGLGYLNPGIGFGGSCLRKDTLSLVHLADAHGLAMIAEYWRNVVRINHFQCDRFLRRVVSRLGGSLSDKKIAIFGWTFKKGTNDSRESQAVRFVVNALSAESVNETRIFDPGCHPADVKNEACSMLNLDPTRPSDLASSITAHDNPYTASHGANAVVLLTDWDQFRCLPTKRLGSGHFNSLPTSSATDGTASRVRQAPWPLIPDIKLNHQSPADLFTGDRLGSLGLDLSCPRKYKESTRTSKLWGEINDQIDWGRISRGMSGTRWVFDGRNVLDAGEMKRLGFQVEAIGRCGNGGVLGDHSGEHGYCHLTSGE